MTSEEEAYGLYRRACELHLRRRAVEAEALYRAAIAGGFDAARFNLGILLRDLGRGREAEAMLTAAVSNDDPEVASRAAFAVAAWLERVRDDPVAAYRFYRVAYERATDGVCEAAALALVLLLAAKGDRETVSGLIQWVTKRRYRRWGVAPITDDSGLRFARFLSAVLMWPPARNSARFNRRVCYRARLLRRRVALVGVRSTLRLERRT